MTRKMKDTSPKTYIVLGMHQENLAREYNRRILSFLEEKYT